MEKSRSLSIAVRGLFVSAFLSTIFGVANASAYTVTFNSTFGEFDGGATTNVVEYNDNHEVVNGEYKEPVYNNGTDSSNFITWYSEYDAKNRVNLDEISSDTTVYAAYEKVTWRWDYTGGEQSFSLPITAGLQLHVWGAQGGTINESPYWLGYYGGYGGYATGLYDFRANQNFYINIGGQGEMCANTLSCIALGGYNGGGNGKLGEGRSSGRVTGGGGATHIATNSGELSSLEESKDSIAIVAGGGGGMYIFNGDYKSDQNTGHGGGYIGARGTMRGGDKGNAPGGKQEPGSSTNVGVPCSVAYCMFGSFGQGYGDARSEAPGGGGGYYGGGSGAYVAGGGSGFIANTIETTRHMAAYNGINAAFTSDEDSTKTIGTDNVSDNPIVDYAKTGNGYAMGELTRLEITYVNSLYSGDDALKDQYVGSLAQELPLTSRTGYTVTWYNGDTKWNFDDPVNFDLTLTAKYTPIVYDLAYNLGTGTLSEPNPDTYTIESDDITLNNPTAPDYYAFLGWSGTDLTGDRNLTVIIPKGSIGNREYTANIAPTPYTITYNLDGGTNGAGNPTEYNYESSEIVLASPTKEGHTFLGWSGTGIDGEDNLDVTIPAQSHGDREYTAHWSINQYTATFDVNGGSAINSDTITSDYGVAFGTLPETAIVGYEFLGWFTEQTGGTKISDTTTMPAEDHTYYAHWEIINYTIEYDLGGADMDSAPTNDASNPTSYTVNDSNITLGAATPGDSWHYFVGWALDRDTEDGLTDNFVIDTAEAKNIKVYAIFQANPYTVTIDPANGEAETTRTVRGDQEIGELPTPTKDGYDFLGWFYGNKQVDEHFHPRSDARIVAHWEEIPMVPNTGVNSMPDTGDAILDNVMAFAVGVFVLFACSLHTRKAEREI